MGAGSGVPQDWHCVPCIFFLLFLSNHPWQTISWSGMEGESWVIGSARGRQMSVCLSFTASSAVESAWEQIPVRSHAAVRRLLITRTPLRISSPILHLNYHVCSNVCLLCPHYPFNHSYSGDIGLIGLAVMVRVVCPAKSPHPISPIGPKSDFEHERQRFQRHRI